MAEAILVTRSRKGKIWNSGFADGVITREERKRRGERRIKGGRFRLGQGGQFFLNLVMTLNPRELAAGVENQVSGLWRRSDRKRDDEGGGGVFERKLEGAMGGWLFGVKLGTVYWGNIGGFFRERKWEGERDGIGLGEGESE